MCRQLARQLKAYHFAKQYGSGIPYLAHRFAPSAFDDEVVRECLAIKRVSIAISLADG
ncbi:MAG: hypothetical protein WCA63_01960 [Gallionella sp.]